MGALVYISLYTNKLKPLTDGAYRQNTPKSHFGLINKFDDCKTVATPSNNIWTLVHSLSSQEKLFFRRDYVKAYALQGTEPLYLKVFDLISKQSTYDEAKLLKQLAPALNAKNISYTKNYLYEQICDALLYFNNHDNTNARIFQQLSLVRIFREKGLYKAALKIWEHAIKEANKYELHPMIQMLKEEYRRLQLYSNPKASQKEMMKEYEEDSISADEHLRILQLQELSFHALLLRRKTHFRQSKEDKKTINTLLQNPLLQKEPKSASFWHLHHYRMAKATLGYLNNDATSYNYAYANIHAWQSKEYFIAHDCENYMEVLYIFYYTAILAKDYQHVIDVMQHSANKQIKGVAHKAYFETIRHLALNRVYNKLADYDKVKVLVKVMKDHIAGWEQYINTDLLRTLRLSVGISCFVLQDYENAFHYVKNATLLFNDDTRPEHYSFANLYLLIICFEMKDDYMFDIQYKSTYSYFYRHEKPLPFENAILQALHKTYKTKSFRSLQENFKELQTSLAITANDPVQQIVFSMFNVPVWIESKLNRVPYKDWVKRRVENELKVTRSAG